MTHYSMLVTGEDATAALAPFDENAEDTPEDDHKWDWWQIGGRYSKRLLTTDGQWVDECLRSGLDMAGMLEAYRDQAARQWVEYQENPRADLFGEAEGLTEKEYVYRYELPTTWGILHKGTWYEEGRLGWFAATDARKEDHRDWAEGWWKFVENLHPRTKLTVVDCHL